MKTVEALALVSGRVDEELLLRNEYLAAEDDVLKSKITHNRENIPVLEVIYQRLSHFFLSGKGGIDFA